MACRPIRERGWSPLENSRQINGLRRQGRLKELARNRRRGDEVADENAARAATEIEDDRLRLIFTCCHPAIDPKLQVPLTLREVCGLTTEEIAHAFLTSKATMAQRIVRGKAKIRDEQIPYVVPSLPDLPERLDAVLSAVYLVFSEGYAASQGGSLLRVDLTAEAIRLGRLLRQASRTGGQGAAGLDAAPRIAQASTCFLKAVKSFYLKSKTAPVGTINK